MKRIRKFVGTMCGAALLASTFAVSSAIVPGGQEDAFAAGDAAKITSVTRKNNNGFSKKIDLKWTKKGTATSYEVQYKLADSDTWPSTSTVTKKTECRIEGLKPHEKYSFRVRAIRGAKQSKWKEAAKPIETFDALKIDMLYAGKGDAVLIKLPNGKTALLDGGVSECTKDEKLISTSKAGKEVAKTGDKICEVLKNLNVTEIDYMISSHPHYDHAGGLYEVLLDGGIKVGEFLYPIELEDDYAKTISWLDKAKAKKAYGKDYPKTMFDAVSRSGATAVPVRDGSKRSESNIDGGNGCSIKFVHSDKNYHDANQDSLVTYVKYNDFDALLPADCDYGNKRQAQNELYKKYNDKHVQVLMLPHHGLSAAGTTTKKDGVTPFVKRHSPNAILVSTKLSSYTGEHELYKTKVEANLKKAAGLLSSKAGKVMVYTSGATKLGERADVNGKGVRGTEIRFYGQNGKHESTNDPIDNPNGHGWVADVVKRDASSLVEALSHYA